MKPVIEVKDLIKRYKKAEKNAVDGVSFSVDEGEFFAFLGPNGAGKTTTISILTTTLSKTSGDVTIAGYDIDRHPTQVRQNIGVIFQNPSLDKNLTAEENIRFHAILYGLYPFSPAFSLMPESYKKRVGELSEVLGLQNDMYKPIKNFSGGMKRKLEIIRSLMHRPKVLFLDEPTSGLDPISRQDLWTYLRDMRQKEKTTIFLTTHYLEEAETADRIAIVNNGKIVAHGTPEKIKHHLIEEYVLLDAKDKKVLTKELDNLKVAYTHDGVFKVNTDKISAQQVIHAIKTPLSLIQIHNPTLEEAYVEIIKEQQSL
ncbi:MAG TPA: ABC transporter ATP-binding protein [Candidatus Saccharimonadales bacterium]|nr:ABC transporter ATP-binding protein [Candidatus Saccharimonadales bacterium]